MPSVPTSSSPTKVSDNQCKQIRKGPSHPPSGSSHIIVGVLLRSSLRKKTETISPQQVTLVKRRTVGCGTDTVWHSPAAPSPLRTTQPHPQARTEDPASKLELMHPTPDPSWASQMLPPQEFRTRAERSAGYLK